MAYSGRRRDIIAKGKGQTRVAPRIFASSGSSADAEIVEGIWPNQEPLSLSARLFFFSGKMELFLSFLSRFFSVSLPKDFFLLLIFPE